MEKDQTNDTWLSATTSLGLLGVIARVKLQVLADFKVYADQTVLDEDHVLNGDIYAQISPYVTANYWVCVSVVHMFFILMKRPCLVVARYTVPLPTIRHSILSPFSRSKEVPLEDLWCSPYHTPRERVPGSRLLVYNLLNVLMHFASPLFR